MFVEIDQSWLDQTFGFFQQKLSLLCFILASAIKELNACINGTDGEVSLFDDHQLIYEVIFV